MRSRMRLIATALTLSLGFIAGCASDSTFDVSRGDASRSTTNGQQSIWNRDSNSVASATPSSTASPTESISRVFRQVSSNVSDAFEIQPRIESATDPAQLSSHPDKLSPALYVRAATWSEDQGAKTKAQQQYAKALELDPQNVKTLVAFARFHDRQGHDSEALQMYRRANSLGPNNVVVLNDIGLFQARRRNFAPALEALQQTVQLAPQNVRYCNNLAGVLVQSGRPNDAVTVLRGVHSEAVANMNVGHFLSMEKDFSQATAYFRQAAQLDPSLVAARDMLEQIGETVAGNDQSAPFVAQAPMADPNANGYQNPYRPVGTSYTVTREEGSCYGSNPPQTTDTSATTTPDGPRRLPPAW